MIRVLLADNDVVSKHKLRAYLKHAYDLNVVAECMDGMDARDKLNILEPDIVILNVELPRMSGFEILGSTAHMKMPYVIFTSADEKYALRAFEFNTIDYLVKPLEKQRFHDAITKARRYIERDLRADNVNASAASADTVSMALQRPSIERVPVKRGRRISLLRTSAIRYIVADRDFTDFHMLTEESIHSSERISQLKYKLPIDRFQRIQRSVIVNLEYVREIRLQKGRYEFVMNNGESFLSGIIYKQELGALFSFWNKRLIAA
jgi:two-component system, LytTR family, response regulator